MWVKTFLAYSYFQQHCEARTRKDTFTAGEDYELYHGYPVCVLTAPGQHSCFSTDAFEPKVLQKQATELILGRDLSFQNCIPVDLRRGGEIPTQLRRGDACWMNGHLLHHIVEICVRIDNVRR